jgi:hypothetical protein
MSRRVTLGASSESPEATVRIARNTPSARHSDRVGRSFHRPDGRLAPSL